MANPIIALLDYLLDIYWYVVLAAVIVSWLTAFNVINERNDFVRTLLRFLFAMTEPVFRQIRRVIPTIGGFDLSPVVVLIAIWWIRFSILPWIVTRFHLYA